MCRDNREHWGGEGDSRSGFGACLDGFGCTASSARLRGMVARKALDVRAAARLCGCCISTSLDDLTRMEAAVAVLSGAVGRDFGVLPASRPSSGCTRALSTGEGDSGVIRAAGLRITRLDRAWISREGARAPWRARPRLSALNTSALDTAQWSRQAEQCGGSLLPAALELTARHARPEGCCSACSPGRLVSAGTER